MSLWSTHSPATVPRVAKSRICSSGLMPRWVCSQSIMGTERGREKDRGRPGRAPATGVYFRLMQLRYALILVTFAAVACHRRAVAPINPQAEVAVTVDNQNFLDMTVYLIRGGQRIRLGMVPGLTKQVLMVNPGLVGYGTDVRFAVHPIGGRGNRCGETACV